MIGWLMFTVSGLFFLIDALETGDKTALASAITWLLGVGFFLVKSKAPDDE
jgi:hypothetical protein